jgi:hypothetical protein
MLKFLALLLPPIRRLYEQRNRLLVKLAVLEERLRGSAYTRNAALEEGHFKEIMSEFAELKSELRMIADYEFQIPNEVYVDPVLKSGFARELVACRSFAKRCLFVVGFARSNTTITLSMLNTAPNALLLGEANFYFPKGEHRFSDWYNAQHISFRNQPTKSTHAPDFIPEVNHTWWEWLSAAASYYDIIGDKMAFSSYHLSEIGGENIQKFFESRFFNAKYVFLIRNPIDTLISLGKLSNLEADEQMNRECDAWLQYVQLWAEWIRNFPNTLTLLVDDFTQETVTQVADFSGLSLDSADSLLDKGNKRKHEIPVHFPTLAAISEEMMEIFNLTKAAVAEERVFWQSEQKRSVEENDSKGDAPKRIAVVPRPLGHAWARAQDLREKLAALQQAQSEKEARSG